MGPEIDEQARQAGLETGAKQTLSETALQRIYQLCAQWDDQNN